MSSGIQLGWARFEMASLNIDTGCRSGSHFSTWPPLQQGGLSSRVLSPFFIWPPSLLGQPGLPWKQGSWIPRRQKQKLLGLLRARPQTNIARLWLHLMGQTKSHDQTQTKTLLLVGRAAGTCSKEGQTVSGHLWRFYQTFSLRPLGKQKVRKGTRIQTQEVTTFLSFHDT